ncbi:hypothetical protein ABPG74_021948 [Tetrahymena malaccensis]
MKYQKNNLSDLINKYIEPDLEPQEFDSQVIESGVDSHLKNWELQIDNLEQDLPIQMLSSIRKILQDNQKEIKRSKSVQSSLKHGTHNQSMRQSKEIKSNRISNSANKKESTSLKEQKLLKDEERIPQKQQENFNDLTSDLSQKKSILRAQSVQENSTRNQNFYYKIFPEWNSYSNNQRGSHYSQSNMSNRELLNNGNNIMQNQLNSQMNYSQSYRNSFGISNSQMQQYDNGDNNIINENQKNYMRQNNDLNNSQQIQRNNIQRSQSATQLKDTYLNNMVQLNDIPIDQSHLVKTQHSFNMVSDLNQNVIQQKSLSQQSQMLEYIHNSVNFQKPQLVKSVNEILQIPANQLQQSQNVRSSKNIQSSQEKRQQGSQLYYLNYNKNHTSQLNKSNLNKINISEQLPQKYQIVMQSIQNPHSSQIYKSQVNASNWEMDCSSPSQMISSYKNINHTQRDNSQRSRKKIFEQYTIINNNQKIKDTYNRLFPRKN